MPGYYVYHNNLVKGPYTLQQLAKIRLSGHRLVCPEGGNNWWPACEEPVLDPLLQGAPTSVALSGPALAPAPLPARPPGSQGKLPPPLPSVSSTSVTPSASASAASQNAVESPPAPSRAAHWQDEALRIGRYILIGSIIAIGKYACSNNNHNPTKVPADGAVRIAPAR